MPQYLTEGARPCIFCHKRVAGGILHPFIWQNGSIFNRIIWSRSIKHKRGEKNESKENDLGMHKEKSSSIIYLFIANRKMQNKNYLKNITYNHEDEGGIIAFDSKPIFNHSRDIFV